MNPEDILKYAQAALARGADPAAVDARTKQLTQGQYTSVKELEYGLQHGADLAKLNAAGGNAVTDFLHEAAQGATFGFSDELRGLGAAIIPGGDNYAQARDKERSRLKSLEALNPGASAAAQIAGAAPLTLLGGSAAGARGAAASESFGGRVLGGVAGGAGVGAGTGLLYGAGTGETAKERAINGAVSAVLGGTLGGLVGGGTALVARLVKGGDAAARAATVLRRALKEAGYAPDEVEAAMARLGNGTVPADLSPNLAREADAAVTQASSLTKRGGPVDKLFGRGAGRGERVVDYLRNASGKPSYEASLSEAQSALEAVRNEAYRPLEQQFKQVTGENVQEALKNGRTAAAAHNVDPAIVPRNNALTPQDIMEQFPTMSPEDAARIAKAGAEQGLVSPSAMGAGESRPPSFTELQSVLGKLRAAAGRAAREGDPDAYIKAQKAAEQLREAMGQDIPGFNAAQARFGPAQEALDAHDLGRSMATKPIRDIKAALGDLRGPGQEAFKVGLRAGLEDSILRSGEKGGATVNKLLQAENSREHWGEVVKIITPDSGAREQLLHDLARERAQAMTERAVGTNSKTAQRLMDAEASQMTPYPSRHGILHRVLQRAFLGNQASRQAAAEQIGNALLTPEGPSLIKSILLQRATSPAGATGGFVGAAGGGGGVRMFNAGG